MRIRLTEAIEACNDINGTTIDKKDVAAKLWPNAKKIEQYKAVTRMERGEIKTIRLEHVQILCEFLGVDANFIFGIEP